MDSALARPAALTALRSDSAPRLESIGRPVRSRNQVWLATTLERLWEEHFWDVPRVSPVQIRFGARWKNRLGLIRWEPATQSSLIAVNALFRDPDVPAYLCEVTIAHEIVHFAHGFGSPLPQRVKDPHADSVIERELEARGLGRQLALADVWIERHWADLHDRFSRALAFAELA
ncbi:MAG TPA: hypothetical protein VHL09_08220 [Dehalococcoidia bacterium]|nr:hypothetical protein [Dehalococcoidia bacterium]